MESLNSPYVRDNLQSGNEGAARIFACRDVNWREAIYEVVEKVRELENDRIERRREAQILSIPRINRFVGLSLARSLVIRLLGSRTNRSMTWNRSRFFVSHREDRRVDYSPFFMILRSDGTFTGLYA